MNPARELYYLQNLDWDIAALQESLSSTKVQLEDDRAVLVAKAKVEQGQQQLKDLRSLQRSIEITLQSVISTANNLETRLYGGTVRNPRELGSMEEEYTNLRTKQHKQEDTLLEAMVSVDEAQALVDKTQDNLTSVEIQWQNKLVSLVGDQERLTSELSSLDQHRQDIAAHLPQLVLSRYELLKTSKQGHAVAKVERGMCQGCRITLPTKEWQQAKTAQELVHCNSCGRILCVS